MIKNHRAVVTGNLTDPSVSGESLDEFKIEVGTNLSGENLISRINMTPGNILIEASHINLKGAVTADAIAVGALEVGKNVTMGPNAVVSWSNLPYNVASYGDIPTNAEITTITQNAVKTEDIIIGGWIWDSFDVGKQRILGVNWNDNLQVGTVSNAHYKRVNIYAPEDINLVHGGGQTADVYGLRVRSNGSVAIKSLATGGSNTGADKASYRIMTVGSDGDIYATATTLKDLTEGSLKVTAVFG